MALGESFDIAIRMIEPLALPELHLPDSATLDLVSRYETSATRKMYQAINQLERLRRRRGGEHIPPPIALA
jgi:hypothetical protein